MSIDRKPTETLTMKYQIDWLWFRLMTNCFHFCTRYHGPYLYMNAGIYCILKTMVFYFYRDTNFWLLTRKSVWLQNLFYLKILANYSHSVD